MSIERSNGKTGNVASAKRILTLLWIAVLACFSSAPAHAQDAGYWNLQYGPKATLLGGAVIGSVEDISAVFYNPGALGMIEDPRFSITANVFQFNRIGLTESGNAQEVELRTSNTGILPSLVAGVIGRGNQERRSRLAYSILSRSSSSYDLRGLVQLSGNEVPPDFDLTDLAGIARIDGSLSEVWAGFTYSYPINEHFGIGATWYGGVRNQRRWTEASLEGVGSGPSGTTMLERRHA